MSEALFTPLIKSRLAPPRIGGAVVHRGHIMPMLARGSPLTLILGPAGSGKTLLCATWRKQLVASGHEVAWYNLGPEDDESQFVAYLRAAFETIGLPLAARADDVYTRSGGQSMRLLLAELVNGLHRHERPVYLVLEDFHLVRQSAVVDFIDRLVALAPAHFHLAISSRTRPPLNLLPLRVRDELTEISFADLRFTLDEARQFLRHQRVDALSATQLHTLHQLTDGWAAGLQLAAMSLRKAPDPQACLQRFAQPLTLSRDHSLHDYLQECVAEHFDEAELDFLARTSTCRRFNRELCGLLTGHAQAEQILLRFEADNLFVIPIEFNDALPWYRFHRLLAAYLNERLAKMPALEVAALHDKASRWFAQRGLYAEAIDHAAAAGNADLHDELVERAARPALNNACLSQLLKWFAQMPRERVRHCGELLRCIGWAQVMAGALEDFDWSIEALETHPSAHDADVVLEMKLLKAFRRLRVDDTAAVLELLAPYLEQPPQARPFDLMLLRNLLAHALIADDRYEQARDLVRDRPRRGIAAPGRHTAPFIDAIVGISFLAEGDMRQARAALCATLDEARSLGVDPSAYVACYLVEAHYQLDELGHAQALLDEFDAVIDVVGMADSQLRAYGVRARLCAARGDLDAALVVTDRMERLARMHDADRVAADGLALRVHFETARRQWPAAREALRRLEARVQGQGVRSRGALADIARLHGRARAELALAMNQPQLAWELLAPLIDESDQRGRLGEATGLRLQAAAVQDRLGQRLAALDLVSHALTTACERGAVRVFIDAGAPVASLLQELVRGAQLGEAESAFALDLLRRLASPDGGVAPPSSPDAMAAVAPQVRLAPTQSRAVESLSPREAEILGLLAQALSTKSIARVLDVSAGTVKWHLKHVYAKLGAASREQAVIKARGMRLIP